MRHLIILFITLTLSVPSFASRVIEVEDYFSQKASDFVKARYPQIAFSVSVKAQVDQDLKERGQSTNRGQELPLPYFDVIETNEVNFWDRKDLSLGTLISYVKSVQVQVDIDREFGTEEMNQFKRELFAYLKLADAFDRIEVTQRQWQSPWSLDQSRNQLLLILFASLVLSLGFFFVFQSGIRKLITGISQPLAELGKNQEGQGFSGGFNGLSGPGTQLATSTIASALTSGLREQFAQDVQDLASFIGNPSPDLIRGLETLGRRDPAAMGSIFKLVPLTDLQNAMRWARGDWWREAITNPCEPNQNSYEFVQELHRLQRKQFLTGQSGSDEFDLILSRLEKKEFGHLLEGLPFEKASQVLMRSPEDIKVSVGKYLYPGQWSSLLERKSLSPVIDTKLKETLTKKALQIAPLLSQQEIDTFFKDAELLTYLDAASTKDEREVYRALNEASWIKKTRSPFFEIFNLPKETLIDATNSLSIEIISLALFCADSEEREKFQSCLSSRQAYVLKKNQEHLLKSPPSDSQLAAAKKLMLKSFNLTGKDGLKNETQEALSAAA